MNLLNLILNDSIAMFSIVGLAIVLGICSFYVYYFLKNINENK